MDKKIPTQPNLISLNAMERLQYVYDFIFFIKNEAHTVEELAYKFTTSLKEYLPKEFFIQILISHIDIHSDDVLPDARVCFAEDLMLLGNKAGVLKILNNDPDSFMEEGLFSIDDRQFIKNISSLLSISISMHDSYMPLKTKNILNVTNQIYLFLDKDFCVLDTNDYASIITEETRDNLINCDWVKEFCSEDSKANLIEYLEKTKSGEISPADVAEYENEIVSRSGKRYMIHWYHSFIFSKNRTLQYVIAFGEDITKVSKATARIKSLSKFPSQNPQPVFRVNRAGDMLIANGATQKLINSLLSGAEYDRDIWKEFMSDVKTANEINFKEINILKEKYRFNIVPIEDEDYINIYGTNITEENKAKKNLASAFKQTIYVLAAALEKRDPYTTGHQNKVAEVCVKIAKKMQIKPLKREGLELAATIHDIGKIYIPAEILNKPGKLSPVEFELIKTHAQVGADILQDIDFAWPIAEIIAQHHERYDGTGYPKGIKGEDILMEARIIAVADTLEAMASHRPYRAGLGIDKAADEIRRGAGTTYDPVVAKACLELIDDGELKLLE